MAKHQNTKIRQRRVLERRWRRLRTEQSRQEYCRKRNVITNQIRRAKTLYYNRVIEENQGDSKKLYANLNKLLGKNKKTILPDKEESELADDFSNFFKNKIKTIYDSFPAGNDRNTDTTVLNGQLSDFRQLSLQDVSKLIEKTKKNLLTS